MKKLFLAAGLCFLGTHLEAQETPVIQQEKEETPVIDEATVKALTESLQAAFKEVMEQEEVSNDDASSQPSTVPPVN